MRKKNSKAKWGQIVFSTIMEEKIHLTPFCGLELQEWGKNSNLGEKPRITKRWTSKVHKLLGWNVYQITYNNRHFHFESKELNYLMKTNNKIRGSNSLYCSFEDEVTSKNALKNKAWVHIMCTSQLPFDMMSTMYMPILKETWSQWLQWINLVRTSSNCLLISFSD
jgi:hypothetical protein